LNYIVQSPLNVNEFELYYDLRYRVLRAPWNQARGSEQDASEKSSIHAMITDGELCIACGRLQKTEHDGVGQIRFMAVDANHQGKGLGKLIVQYLEARAKEEAMGEIILQARENAVEFYKSLEYELVEPTFKLFGEIQHYLMRKQLH